jgi:hypothetical protein
VGLFIPRGTATDVGGEQVEALSGTQTIYTDTGLPGESLSQLVLSILTVPSNRSENVTMANRGCGGGITAWKGTGTPGKPERSRSRPQGLTSPSSDQNHFGVYQANGRVVIANDAVSDLSK